MKKENEFINILGEASWEDSVQEVLKKYKLDVPDENSFLSILDTDDFYLHMEFDDSCESVEQKEKKAEGNSYLQKISFDLDDPSEEAIELPFGICREQSYEELVTIIGHAGFQSPKGGRKIWRLQKENEETYQLTCLYKDEFTRNSTLSLSTYNPERKYTSVPNELLKEN